MARLRVNSSESRKWKTEAGVTVSSLSPSLSVSVYPKGVDEIWRVHQDVHVTISTAGMPLCVFYFHRRCTAVNPSVVLHAAGRLDALETM